uniref:Uncharacterized protein n=1 Tax=Arundo donax TaxID=35708 RepID=A0A0A9FH32_ARUDO
METRTKKVGNNCSCALPVQKNRNKYSLM